jgi:membrane protein DedA with SNARE-associated domain
VVAGSSKVRYSVFILFAGTGAVIWSSLFLALGYFLRDRWKRFGAGFKEHRVEVILGVVLIMAVCLWWDWRRRRKMKMAIEAPLMNK